MPRYEAIGKHFETGKKHRRPYKAANETEAIHLALKDGIIAEHISRIPEEGPTDAQLNYARDLGIIIPGNVTKHEISDLISVKVENDRPSSAKHQAFAKKYGVECTEYIGKEDLFERILETLKSPGRERELAEWFTYRVYRELMNGADDVPIDGPEHPIIKEISGDLSKFDNVITSMRRYRGRDIIWFGEWTAPNGQTYKGGSEGTIAYKMASAALRQHLDFPEPAKKITPESVSTATGMKVTSSGRICGNCGLQISRTSGRCPHCGARHDYGGLGWALAIVFAIAMFSIAFQCGR